MFDFLNRKKYVSEHIVELNKRADKMQNFLDKQIATHPELFARRSSAMQRNIVIEKNRIPDDINDRVVEQQLRRVPQTNRR